MRQCSVLKLCFKANVVMFNIKVTYPTIKMVPTVGYCPEKLAINRQEHAINVALPFALKVTLNGITKRTTRRSARNRSSQACSISGIATALKQ